MAAGSSSTSAPGAGTTVTCIFPHEQPRIPFERPFECSCGAAAGGRIRTWRAIGERNLVNAPPQAEIPDPARPTWTIVLPDEAATEALRGSIAGEVRPGDLVTLSGAASGPARPPSRGRWCASLSATHPRSAEPDLHADAGLRDRARSSSSTPTSTGSGGAELVELGWEETTERPSPSPNGPSALRTASRSGPALDIALEIEPRAGTRGGSRR